MSDTPLQLAAQGILAYHDRTAHRFQAYARGPETLDWDAQPAPFRHFAGSPSVALPRLGTGAASPAARALDRPFAELGGGPAVALDLASLGFFLQLSLGLTAWKQLGPDRWAVRANPSSGNLHPLEAYLLIEGLAGLTDGLYHYRAEDHALELRAALPAPAGITPRVLVGLSSVMWREAWKYGERAFRYCQLDVGHGMAALGMAARALGWGLEEGRQWGHGDLARLLGLDRSQDFPASPRPDVEREEPEAVLLLWPAGAKSPGVPGALPEGLAAASWLGQASSIDPHPFFRWPVVDQVAGLTRRVGPWADETAAVRQRGAPLTGQAPVREVIMGRRSAQRFDPARTLTAGEFEALLGATLPGGALPWAGLVGADRLNLMVYVHRVEGYPAGIYFLERVTGSAADFLARVGMGLQPVKIDAARGLALWQLGEAEPVALRRLVRSLHCHQDIAATACLALGMVAPLEEIVRRDPAAYRDVHREAGVIGQMLYLQAEALGLRGTGIGCYFDGPVMEAVGMGGGPYRTVYHFTVGAALADSRIETLPA
ncbi:MAG: SagB family peptide dehydrogenase [Rhodocyclaceae bacterium]|nr:SagB family peptide dehydrogenase [Rhodocyclaceae bacterium]